MMNRIESLLVLVSLAGLAGCHPPTSQHADVRSQSLDGSSTNREAILVAEAPVDAVGVIAARADAQHDEAIVVTGRIGGSTNPWIADRAAFSLVDLSCKPCNDLDDDHCDTPWDYCCESKLPKARLLVKVVDEAGEVVAADARKLLGLKELQTLVVSGKAKRDADGNLSILARRIHIASP